MGGRFVAVLALLAMTMAAACKDSGGKAADTGLAGYDPRLVDLQRMACEKRGGTFSAAGRAGTFACYENTRDGGKSCSRSTDCEGLCLAPSRTCAPIKPLYGCNDVLTENGTRATICVD